MKPETAKQLDRLILMQRLKVAAIASGIALAVLGFVLFIGYEEQARVDKVTATTNIHGTIVQAKRRNGRNGSYQLIVKLKNGRSIKTYSQLSAGIPYQGERVDLQEIVHKSGLKNYVVTHLLDDHR